MTDRFPSFGTQYEKPAKESPIPSKVGGECEMRDPAFSAWCLENYSTDVLVDATELNTFIKNMIDKLVELSENNPTYPHVTQQLHTAWESYKEYIVKTIDDFSFNMYNLELPNAILAVLIEMVKFPRYGNQPFDQVMDNGMWNCIEDEGLGDLISKAVESVIKESRQQEN